MSVNAVFLDRDGTVNYDTGYMGNPEEIKLYPGVAEGISKLKSEFGFKVIVISNQSGIARGLITRYQVDSVNDRINKILSETFNTSIDKFYYCPYHPDFNSEELCECRKPSPQMINTAVNDYKIDISGSYLIGDMPSDIECGNNAGVKTVLVSNSLTSEQINSLQNGEKTPNFVADNFLEACKFIIEDFQKEK